MEERANGPVDAWTTGSGIKAPTRPHVHTSTRPHVPDRIHRARHAMAAAGIDGLLLTQGADLRYLTGLGDVHAGKRLMALILTGQGGLWISPLMNVAQIEAHNGGIEEIRAWEDAQGYQETLRGALEDLGLASARVAVDEEMRARFLLDLQGAQPSVTAVGAGAVMGALRIRKDAEELRLLRESGKVVDAVIPVARASCRAGRAEREVADTIRDALVERAPGFETEFCIVGSGPNGALPHHDTGGRSLATGEPVIMDYGGFLDGYVADITQTVCIGEPADPEVERVYRIVWEAQQRAIEAVRPGATCGAVDGAARSHIEAAGYGPFFLHRTGHGVGLHVHEPPFLLSGSEERLEEGMCFSIEPGIYLRDRFGVRLEVLVTVTSSGVELLNQPSSKEMVRV